MQTQATALWVFPKVFVQCAEQDIVFSPTNPSLPCFVPNPFQGTLHRHSKPTATTVPPMPASLGQCNWRTQGEECGVAVQYFEEEVGDCWNGNWNMCARAVRPLALSRDLEKELGAPAVLVQFISWQVNVIKLAATMISWIMVFMVNMVIRVESVSFVKGDTNNY
ncbi:hypothetical protein E2542_SST04909 [Spatholobus suberectus]|nr:hypothetical protein E2542_SST04909 [Spatholobus suberectus]